MQIDITLQARPGGGCCARDPGFLLHEHPDHPHPPRLSSLELPLFAEARPPLVVVTPPNRDYSALFPGMPEDAAHGAPSQMAVFRLGVA